MTSRTRELLQQTEDLPEDEFSITHADRDFSDRHSAEAFFKKLKRRLVDLANWNANAGLSSYELFDANGLPAEDQRLKKGCFLAITLHGSGKSDWVRVENIFESDDEIVITVSPTFDPTADPVETGKVSHFFSADATNNFCAFVENACASIYVIGLNERLNAGHASGTVEKLRNTIVANVGYYLGIQKAEWAKFCESFLSDAEEHGEQ